MPFIPSDVKDSDLKNFVRSLYKKRPHYQHIIASCPNANTMVSFLKKVFSTTYSRMFIPSCIVGVLQLLGECKTMAGSMHLAPHRLQPHPLLFHHHYQVTPKYDSYSGNCSLGSNPQRCVCLHPDPHPTFSRNPVI